jgi:hypothetical protein
MSQAQLNFEGYNNVVAASMSNPVVGGSQACLDAIAGGHATIGDMLQSSDGQSQLASMFNVCNATALSSIVNQADWAGQGVIYLPVQENDPACSPAPCNINDVCTIMTNDSIGTPLQRLAYLSNVQNDNQVLHWSPTLSLSLSLSLCLFVSVPQPFSMFFA